MLYVYDKAGKKIMPCEATDFQAQQLMERQHLETWVEEYPEMLGEKLLVLATEFDQFDKTGERLDLLALDPSGKLVIIELKRDDSGRTVELQALKYAAYCSTLEVAQVDRIYADYLSRGGTPTDPSAAHQKMVDFMGGTLQQFDNFPRIILVAREFRPEVTATVLWLQKCHIDLRCIVFTPYVLEPGKIAITSRVLIPVPETEALMIKAELNEQAADDVPLSKVKREYLAVFGELKAAIEKRLNLTLSDPQPRSYYQIPTPFGSVHFEWGFHGSPRSSFGVELHFEKGNRQINQRMLGELETLRQSIEAAVGEPVTFQPDWGQTWSRLYLQYPSGEVTDHLKAWAVDKMDKFYRVLRPELDKRKSLM